MVTKLVLAQSRLQRTGRVGVFCTVSQFVSDRVQMPCSLSLCPTENRRHVFGTLTHWPDFQHATLFPPTRQPRHTLTSDRHVTSHDFFSKLQGGPSSPGVCSPQLSNVEAFTAATGSLDVGVVEHKLTGQFVFHKVHLCA